MTLSLYDWIAKIGSCSKAARLLGTSRATVNNWKNKKCLPDFAAWRRIDKASKGTVSIEKTYNAFVVRGKK